MATIKSKLIVNVCIAIFIVIGIIGMNYFGLRELKQMQDVGAKRAADAVLAKEASMGGMGLYQIIADAIINRKLSETEKEWTAKKAEVLKNFDEISKAAETPEEKKLCADSTAAVKEIIAIYENKMLPVLKSTDGLTAEIRSFDEMIDKPVRSIEETMDKLVGSLGVCRALHHQVRHIRCFGC